ncbi:MAG: calcineurin-like phosphoesterase family protein [Cytophagaceae bacterium]|jgi:hypothetical protein|nr:calcineurin-like phosphoesterase family protein [Cytophagaceae bacterium]
MKHLFLNITIFTFLFSLTYGLAAQSDELRYVSGTVFGDGIELAGVVVTDGLNVTTTDINGKYELHCDHESKFVYLSVPAGYAPPVDNGVVKFYSVPENGKETDFKLTKTTNDSKHSFIAISDIQILREVEFLMLDEAVQDIRKFIDTQNEAPSFMIDCGDMVFDRLNFFSEYISGLSKLNLPVYRTLGNHDMDYGSRTNTLSMKSYNKTFGPDYYSFNKGKVHYIVLNNVFYLGRTHNYIGYIDERQMEWLARDLSFVKPGTPVFLMMHIPSTYPEEDLKRLDYYKLSLSLVNNEALYNILKPYNAHLLTGHNHTAASFVITDSLMEHNIPAISGSWWQTAVCPDGTPAGYAIFSIDGENITWQYKAIGKPYNEQFEVYLPRKDKTQPDTLVVNVWNYDSQWKVEWYQDDVYKGEMERYTEKDPLISEILSDRSKLLHDWTQAEDTEHLFRAFPAKNAKSFEIKVTDRFGNIFRKTIKGNL